MTSPYETLAREKKVTALCAVLRQMMAEAESTVPETLMWLNSPDTKLWGLTPKQAICFHAQVPDASETTWAQVRVALERSEA